jgi:V8-like Glu-specific endopeptidase
MTVRTSAIVGSMFALTLSSTAVARAQDAAVVAAPTRATAAVDPSALKPVVNKLKAPDMSSAIANSPDGLTGGVMRADGPDSFATFSDRAFGTFGIPYTTARVQLGNQSAAGTTSDTLLSTTYPYRTVGKLTFSAGYCTASLIRRSVIVTAAHCIQSFGSNGNLYSNFQFRPGHYGASGATAAQTAPYGTFTWAALVRPGSWADGTDIGSGSARDNDLAVIALNKNSANQFVGDLVGWMTYGWNNYSFVSSSKTGNLSTGAVSTFGYPALMDSGAIMQRTDGPTYTTTVSNAGQLWQGSNFTGGSSGGPWVVNFAGRTAVLSGGAVVGSAPVMAVIGVTSWGSADPNGDKDNYASQFRQNTRYPNASYGVYGAGNIASLLNTLCSTAAPGGGTFASTGYCD